MWDVLLPPIASGIAAEIRMLQLEANELPLIVLESFHINYEIMGKFLV